VIARIQTSHFSSVVEITSRAFGWIGSMIAFDAVVRHRRGVVRYQRTFADVAFRQISRLAGVACFSQRKFVRSALTSPLPNPKCSKRSTIELVLLERTSVIIGAPPSFNFDMREEEMR
jgi:hypothetical protein